MVFLLALGAPVTAGLGYLWCYGGLRGPVDWLARGISARAGAPTGRIALTFDDGPDPVRTPLLLDVLAAAGVQASFFLVGEAVDRHPELARRIAEAGHDLGNHTYSHAYLPLRRSDSVLDQLARTDRAIRSATGVQPTRMRPPYGGRRLATVRACRRRGQRMVLWDINPFDWRGGSADAICAHVMAAARPGSVVLLHEARPGGETTVEAVRRLIPALRARGLEPSPLRDLGL
jgi:peptidoglycan-N-acetylglucosamine deacetylase